MNEGERREDEEISISGKRSSTRSREMIKFFRIFTHFLATMFEENLGNRTLVQDKRTLPFKVCVRAHVAYLSPLRRRFCPCTS